MMWLVCGVGIALVVVFLVEVHNLAIAVQNIAKVLDAWRQK